MPAHTPIMVNGNLIEFTHLLPFTINIESRRANKNLTVNVRFSNHCYSNGLKEGEITPKDLPIIDSESSRPRVFCPYRYEQSKLLPKVVKTFEDQRLKVYQTSKERNWVYSLSIESNNERYYIFFEIKKSSSHNQHKQNQDLDLVIESAYTREESPRCRKEPIRFGLLCSKIFLGEEVKTRR